MAIGDDQVRIDTESPEIWDEVTTDTAEFPAASAKQKIAMSVAVILPLLGVVTAIVMLWQYGWMGWPYLAMMLLGWCLTSLVRG